MKLMWMSNAPWAGSGYGVQTKLFAPELKAAGHDPAVIAFWGLEGGMIDWRGIPIYPKGMKPYSVDIVAAHASHHGAGLVVSLIDAWVLPPMVGSLKEAGIRWASWYMVDQDPLPPAVRDAVALCDYPIAPTVWGQQVSRDAGIDATYIPLGVDTDAYKPMPMVEARGMVGLPEDAWIVGMVAANKCPFSRKAFPQALEGFARFAERHPDARLYLHTELTPEHGGWDIHHLVQHFGLEDRVHGVSRYLNHMGLPDDHMRAVYSSMDVLLAPSLGEGFGVPLIEAQACGTPVITGDWTAMTELAQGPGNVLIPESDAFRWFTQQGGYWRLPQPAAIAAALEESYLQPRTDPMRVRASVVGYDHRAITRDYWVPFLDRVAQDMAPAPVVDEVEVVAA